MLLGKTKSSCSHFCDVFCCFSPPGFSHHYQLDESIFIFRGVRCDFHFFLYNFSMKFLCANRIDPDGTPRSAASHLGLYCLSMSHKRDARLK